MILCANGLHEINPDATWRAPNGARCRDCYLETQGRYEGSNKAIDRHHRYNRTAKGYRRRIRTNEREGWDTYLLEAALEEAERYEARPPEEAHLARVEWLDIHEPLPLFRTLRPGE